MKEPRTPAHAELISGRDVHGFVRYIVAPEQPNGISGFHYLKEVSPFAIYENDQIPINQEIEKYSYEFQLPIEKPALNLLLEKGFIKSIPPLTLWR